MDLTKSIYFSFYEPAHDAVIGELMDKIHDLECKMQGQILHYQFEFAKIADVPLAIVRGTLRYWECKVTS